MKTYINLYFDFLKFNIAKAIMKAKNIPKELLLIKIPDSLSKPKSSEQLFSIKNHDPIRTPIVNKNKRKLSNFSLNIIP